MIGIKNISHDDRPTVAVFSAFYEPWISGAERFVKEVVERLTSRYHFVILTARLSRRLPAFEKRDGFEIMRLGIGHPLDKWFFIFLAPLAGLFLKPAVFHAVMESYAGIALWLTSFLRPSTPRVLTLQSGDLDSSVKQSYIPRWLWKRIHISPSETTAISGFLANRAKSLGVPPARVRVIPNGVNLEQAKSVRAAAKRVEGRIVCVARLSPEKGLEDLIKAMPLVLARIPEAELVIVGDGVLKNELKKLADSLGVSRAITWRGALPNREALAEAAQGAVFVCPSLAEGLGIVFIEAQALGVPVVATNVGGIPDVVSHEETGLLVPPRNYEALAGALTQLLQDRDLAARLSALAETRLHRFEWNTIAAQVGELYAELLPPPGAKILIATGIFPPDIGGPAKYAETLVSEAAKRGVRADILTYGEDGDDLAKKVYRVSRMAPPVVRHLFYAWRVWRLGKSARAILALDTVSAGLPATLANLFLKKRLTVKVVGDYAWEQAAGKGLTADSLDDFQNKKYSLRIEILRALQKFVARRADAVFAPSEYLKKIVSGWVSGEVKVVYNAVAPAPRFNQQHSNILKNVGISLQKFPGKEMILSAGRLVPWKGFASLIEIMPELLQKNGNFHLVILGDGPDRSKLEKIIQEKKLESAVTLAGRVSHKEVGEYLSEARVFVLNSGYEGLSHQLLEAMQARVPVAASKIGGNLELLEWSGARKTGYGFEYNNRKEMTWVISALTSDEKLREECVKGALLKLENFTVPKMIDGALKNIFPERESSDARVLIVSLDSTILNQDSPSWRRMHTYAKNVGHLTVLALQPGKHFEEDWPKLRIVSFGGKNKLNAFKNAYFGAKKLSHEERPDVVISQDPFFAGLIAKKIAKAIHGRLLVELHGDFWTDDIALRPDAFRKFLAKNTLMSVDGIRVVSRRVKRGLLREFPVLKDKMISVFPVGSEESRPLSDWVEKVARSPSLHALFVGNLVKEKGLDWFLPVFAKVADNLKLHLRIVGDGPERRRLQTLVEQLGIGAHVTFAGRATSEFLDNEYKTADFLVLPSRQESWGRVVVEALQHALPALVTKEVGFAEDILRDGESAVVVPFGDNAAMEEGLRKMTDVSLRKKLAEAGRATAAQFTFENSTAETISFWSGKSEKNTIE